MTETERKSLIKQIESFSDWMKDSSGYEYSDTDITELIKDEGDIYEVYVIIHLLNGENISLRNHCYDSFTSKIYRGDTMYYQGELSCITDDDDYIDVCYNDYNKTYHQCTVPLSSICYVEGYSVSLNWKNLYEHIWKKRNGE